MDTSSVEPRTRRVATALALTTSASSNPSTPGVSREPHPPTATNEVKRIFKRLCRYYMKHRQPPPAQQMQQIWRLKGDVGFEDFVRWKDEVRIKKGVIYDDDGTIIFEHWPVPPH